MALQREKLPRKCPDMQDVLAVCPQPGKQLVLPVQQGFHQEHPSGWFTEPRLGMASPRDEFSEASILPEQISLHSHPGHDFYLGLESQCIPCARGTGYKRATLGAVGDTCIASHVTA